MFRAHLNVKVFNFFKLTVELRLKIKVQVFPHNVKRTHNVKGLGLNSCRALRNPLIS